MAGLTYAVPVVTGPPKYGRQTWRWICEVCKGDGLLGHGEYVAHKYTAQRNADRHNQNRHNLTRRTVPKRYRKLPVEISAEQWTGTNITDLTQWAGQALKVDESGVAQLWVNANQKWLPLDVTEWIAKDQLGFYPIKDEVFIKSYELVGDV